MERTINMEAQKLNWNCNKESPEYLQISLAAAMTLGFVQWHFYRNAIPHCINLILTYEDGCHASCAYCGLGRDRDGMNSKKNFIRVEWPRYPLKEIINRSKLRMDNIERFCVSMIMNHRAVKDTVSIINAIKSQINTNISVLSNPSSMKDEDIQRFKDAGADRFTVAIDCATKEIFDKYRGIGVKGQHKWERYWDILKKARPIFGNGNIGCHLIAGLGETEKEMLHTIQRVKDMGGTTHLFSFYQEAGSLLENHPQCPVGQFRRIQLARYVIDFDYARVDDIIFDEKSRVSDFGVSEDILDELIKSGIPFQTSGCPGKDKRIACCNRPFGDSRPSDIRSYPFRLEQEDVERTRRELLVYSL